MGSRFYGFAVAFLPLNWHINVVHVGLLSLAHLKSQRQPPLHSSISALFFPFFNLFGKEIEAQRTGRLIKIDILAFMLIGLGGLLNGSVMPAVIGLFVIVAGQHELLAVRIREQQRRRGEEEEPLTVLPADPGWQDHSPRPAAQTPVFTLQPRISVYIWDNQTGTWRKEPGTV